MKTLWIGKPAFWGCKLGVTFFKTDKWYELFFRVKFDLKYEE